MGRYIRDLWAFVVGAWGAIAFAAVSFIDPLGALKDMGVDLGYRWLLSPDERRATFMVLAFLWMFVWFSRTRRRFETATEQPNPDMPLHIACRWIARDSSWAAEFDSAYDQEWPRLVYGQLMSAVMMGRIELFGERRPPGREVLPLAHMAGAFKDVASWDASKLVADEPPSHMWSSQGGSEVYYRVMLDSRQVKKVWPPKSLWAQLRKRSPVERIGGYGYGGIFARQDQGYKLEKYPDLPLAAIMGWIG